MTYSKEEIKIINEAGEKHKRLTAQYKNLPTISLNDIKHSIVKHYGIAFTNNNRQYYGYVKVIAENDKSVRVELLDSYVNSESGYKIGTQWTHKFKTKSLKNRLFSTGGNLDTFIDVIQGLNETEKILDEYARLMINQYWRERQKEAEEQHKKDGVYKTGETYLINENGLNKIKDNWEISE